MTYESQGTKLLPLFLRLRSNLNRARTITGTTLRARYVTEDETWSTRSTAKKHCAKTPPKNILLQFFVSSTTITAVVLVLVLVKPFHTHLPVPEEDQKLLRCSRWGVPTTPWTSPPAVPGRRSPTSHYDDSELDPTHGHGSQNVWSHICVMHPRAFIFV